MRRYIEPKSVNQMDSNVVEARAAIVEALVDWDEWGAGLVSPMLFEQLSDTTLLEELNNAHTQLEQWVAAAPEHYVEAAFTLAAEPPLQTRWFRFDTAEFCDDWEQAVGAVLCLFAEHHSESFLRLAPTYLKEPFARALVLKALECAKDG